MAIQGHRPNAGLKIKETLQNLIVTDQDIIQVLATNCVKSIASGAIVVHNKVNGYMRETKKLRVYSVSVEGVFDSLMYCFRGADNDLHSAKQSFKQGHKPINISLNIAG